MCKTVEKREFDFEKIYKYEDYPDKASGRCDHCGQAHFKSSVKDYVFLRECINCGLKKSI